MSNEFKTNRKLAELKKTYFSNEAQHVLIKKGDTLLTGDTYNNRLYLVLDGRLNCFLKEGDGKDYEVLQSTRNMFLGVYSFFSYEHRSHLTVVAAEDSHLAFLEMTEELVQQEKFARDFLPVIVHEIYLRQVLARELNRDRQAAVKKLYESEKMVLLGQLAAGLAHELNNAVGILERNTEWLISELTDFIKNKELQSLFLAALQDGQQLSTSEIRTRRDKLEKRFGVATKVAKQLAKTNLSDDQLEHLIKQGLEKFEHIHRLTASAIVLHDMRIAANHATHVVRSVRDLGSNQNVQPVQTTIYDTLTKALALTKNLTKHVNIRIEKQTDGPLLASPGDLVQVWVNLIKNGCESMLLADAKPAVLAIVIAESEDHYTVTITDNGTGIREEVMKKIFQPNFTTKVTGLSFGLGLGLSIVKKIVDNYRGTIHVKSKAGETEFMIQLPK